MMIRSVALLWVLCGAVLAVAASSTCTSSEGEGGRTTNSGGGGAGVSGGSGAQAGGGEGGSCYGGGAACVEKGCWGIAYRCGDCRDSYDDGLVDMADPTCLSPCDDSEGWLYSSWRGSGDDPVPCSHDCFYDGDHHFTADACNWNTKCDPLSVAPDFPPEGDACAYDPDVVDPYGGTCAEMLAGSDACRESCLPFAPNGCDCFGCCELTPGSGSYVWVNSEDVNGHWSCELEDADDPQKCRPCTPVSSCLNPCEPCEICVGKPEPELGCGDEQVCPDGQQRCGLPCQPPCPVDEYCRTGCCTPVPVAPWD